MTAPAPRNCEQLLVDVLTALEDDDVAVARRHLIKARASIGEDEQLRGAITALDLVCDLRADVSDEQWQHQLCDLQARTPTEDLAFATAVGCTLSDAGDGLAEVRLLEAAERWFAQLIATKRDAISVLNHAVVLERLDRLDDAVAAFSNALELDPDSPAVELRLARVASRAGQLSRSVDAYRAYLQAHPEDAHEWISLAIALCDKGEIHEAEQAYWRAAGLEPSNVSLHFNWLISAQRAGDLERARDALAKLRAIAPHDWRTCISEGYVLEESGDVAGAFRHGRQVFLELLDEPSDDDFDSSSVEYVAGAVARSASRVRDELGSEVAAFVDDVIAAEVFTHDTLALIRALEHPEEADLRVYFVQVEALYANGGEPFGCFVNYRVLARDAAAAATHARQFEARCGADEVRVVDDETHEIETQESETQEIDACEEPSHPGVDGRSHRMTFPASELGTPA
ncbi:MAG TPA: tetratricopeptide repeat protein [Kofleriaceae bacterium]|nr:tetratricopeptide repeat protein [Kofleriaceae bacterium]